MQLLYFLLLLLYFLLLLLYLLMLLLYLLPYLLGECVQLSKIDAFGLSTRILTSIRKVLPTSDRNLL